MEKKIEVTEELVDGGEIVHSINVGVKENPSEDCSEGLKQ